MRRAALYARVSTQRQEQEETIENQLHEIKERIAKDGDALLEECIYADDGWTGTILARPGLDRLREDARRGLFDTLYVYDRGRLARKFVYQEIVIEELVNQGIEFITLHDVKAETPEEQVLQAMQGVFHEYERVKMYERCRSGKLRKVRAGKLLGYNAPYGYRYVPQTSDEDGRLVIEPEEAEVVRLMFRWVGEERATVREVIRQLNQLGIPPRKRKRPTWTTGPVVRLLRNETYAGVHHYNKSEAIEPRQQNGNAPIYRRVKKTARRPRPKGDWIPIKVPAIIDRELFEKAQRQLAWNARFSPRNARHQYLLSGVIYCPCGLRRAGEKRGGLFYYRCTNRLRRFPLPPTCRVPSVNAPIIDVMVWNKLIDLLTHPDLLREQAARWLDRQRHRTDTVDGTIDQLEEEKRKLLAEEERYVRAYGAGALSLEVYRSQVERLLARKKRIEEQIAIAPRQHHHQSHELSPDQLGELASKTISTFNFADRQSLVRQLVEKVVADRESVVISGHVPVKSKHSEELCSNHGE